MNRLPQMRPSSDHGFVYVVKHKEVYKIGFSRSNVPRRVRASEGELLITIPTGQMPSQLEYAINHRFAAKRLPNHKPTDGGAREWFALDAADLEWLQGFARFMEESQV